MPKYMKGKGVWDTLKGFWKLLTNPGGAIVDTIGDVGSQMVRGRKRTEAEKRATAEGIARVREEDRARANSPNRELNAEYKAMNSNEEGEGRRRRKGGVKSLRAKLAEPPKKGGNFGDDFMKGFNGVVGTIGSLFGLGSRADLPTTREGYCELAKKMTGKGHPIRVNSGSQLKSIRANFIKKLGL
jgi:hypothetical protein